MRRHPGRERFGCRRNADTGECEAMPYRLPKVDPVSRSMSGGAMTFSARISAPTSQPSERDRRASTAALARAASPAVVATDVLAAAACAPVVATTWLLAATCFPAAAI